LSFLFRFAKVWLLSLLAPKVSGAAQSSTLHFRVWPNDLDLNLHVNNGRYLTLMDLGRMDLMFRSGAIRYWFEGKLTPLVGLSFCRHFKALRLFQAFELQTKLLGWDEKWVYFEHRFESKGKLYALGIVKGLMAGPQGLLPSVELMRLLGIQETSPELKAYLKDLNLSERGVIDELKKEGHA
jgi:acyl-CoA thioesterase FadM